ncbi:MAG: hypothetical protein HY784_06595 [Chloroflexi bacterium]|nr:hypothetical protein [Chloroflexota bacterium]
MNEPVRPPYPDLSGIFLAKAQRRRALAALSWEEKIAIVEQMRALLPRGMWREKTAAGGATPVTAPTLENSPRAVEPGAIEGEKSP